jgi:hypothetical protein
MYRQVAVSLRGTQANDSLLSEVVIRMEQLPCGRERQQKRTHAQLT